MATVDTISFTTHIDYLREIDSNKFKVSVIRNPNGLKIVNHTLVNKKLGLDKVSINQTYGSINIKASSKILGANYKKGISMNTLEQLVSEINKSGLKLDLKFIDDCNLKRVDVKNDLSLNKNVKDYINSMNHLIAPKFIKTCYEHGISFNESIKTNPIRLVGYNKMYEMTSKNKAILKDHPVLIDQFQNVIRVESTMPKKGIINKYIGSTSLLDTLKYRDLNYSIFKKIIDKQTHFNQTPNTSEMTNTDEKNFAHIYYLNAKYNGDFNAILNHIKGKLSNKTKASYHRGLIKKNLALINNFNHDETLENINEIIDALQEK